MLNNTTNYLNTTQVTRNLSNTLNGSQETWDEEFDYMIAMYVIMTIGILDNILVVWTVIYVRYLHTSMYISAASLAVADALYLVFGPLSLMGLHGVITANTVFCTIIEYLADSFAFISTLHIILISFERYVAVVMPLRARAILTNGRLLKIIVGMYIGGLLYTSPDISWIYYLCVSKPKLEWQQDLLIVTSVLRTAIPFLVILFFNIRMTIVIMVVGVKRRRVLTNHTSNVRPISNSGELSTSRLSRVRTRVATLKTQTEHYVNTDHQPNEHIEMYSTGRMDTTRNKKYFPGNCNINSVIPTNETTNIHIISYCQTSADVLSEQNTQLNTISRATDISHGKERRVQLKNESQTLKNQLSTFKITTNKQTNTNRNPNQLTNTNSNSRTNHRSYSKKPTNQSTNTNTDTNNITDFNTLTNQQTNTNISQNQQTDTNIPTNQLTNTNILTNQQTNSDIISQNQQTNTNTPTTQQTNIVNIPTNQHTNTTIRPVIMMGLVTIIFLVLVWPFHMIRMLKDCSVLTMTKENVRLWSIMTWAGRTCLYINSAVNPFIYTVVSPSFRSAVVKSFRLNCGR